jgi:hypothetical protein
MEVLALMGISFGELALLGVMCLGIPAAIVAIVLVIVRKSKGPPPA